MNTGQSSRIYIKNVPITVGSDPEGFVYDRNKKTYVPASHTCIKGTKQKPEPLDCGGFVQIDGCAIEFNTPPVQTLTGFQNAVQDCVKEIENKIGDRYNLKFIPLVTFKKDLFDDQDDIHKQLGCDPDFSPRGKENMVNIPKGWETTRTCGGHIHLGYKNVKDEFDPKHFYDCRNLTYYLSPNLISVEYSYLYDNNRYLIHSLRNRKSMYGGNYGFRPKKYGVELRSLSNVWVDTPELQTRLWKTLQTVTNKLNFKKGIKYDT